MKQINEINQFIDNQLYLHFQDDQWPKTQITHDRLIVRAIVYDEEGFFYFVRATRDDEFGKAILIETSGGGVESHEDLHIAIKRELKEELGAEVEIICKLGVIEDYYNLICRHNINHYYLCKVISFGENQLTKEERENFHISTLKLTYEQAIEEYEKCACTKVGKLIAQRELPILEYLKESVKN